MENKKGWFKPTDNPELEYKWYNSKNEVIYMNEEMFRLCRKVHDVIVLNDEEGYFTYKVNVLFEELTEIQDIAK